MKITEAVTYDVDSLHVLQTLLCKEDCPEYLLPDSDRMRRGIQQSVDSGHYIIAKKNGVPIGCLRFQTMFSDWNADLRVFIDGIYVIPDERKKGVCTTMLLFVFDKFKSSVCDYQLAVHRKNTNAVNLYKKLGFTSEDYEMLTKWNDARKISEATAVLKVECLMKRFPNRSRHD
jgi:ribosomal protein S18 acetylase RimI-like enzyme